MEMLNDSAVAAALAPAAAPIDGRETPTPGWRMFTTTSPTMSARQLATSNQIIALPPRRPSFLKSPVPAIPTISVLKISGTTIILIMRMKASPSGLS